MDDTEINEVRKYIWNRNDADLIFYYPPDNIRLTMMYAKYSPTVNYGESVLDTFYVSQKDLDKLEKIRQWQFDSGVFWLNYHSFINKAKYRGIDSELVFTLKTLKDQLNSALLQLIHNLERRNGVVQALIDRTLYIKYLEDNHIINSYFFLHYFGDSGLNYEKLLGNSSNKEINRLYSIIHEIFNNALFDQPTVEDEFLTREVRNLIVASFKADLGSGQLRLYDFQFNVLPLELISYIYEVFLSDKQKESGIYYTPLKLAQLIVDEVINGDSIGPLLDPSCGSGMFLIVGFQKLLEIARRNGLEPRDSLEKIRFRNKLLSDNIFGVEKELTAQRFTLFSLSLQIFTGIDSVIIKDFITNELKENKKIDLFSQNSFFGNIVHGNSLDPEGKAFQNIRFSYLIGNPPFFEIPNTLEYADEVQFLNTYQIAQQDSSPVPAKNIVGRSQISQCFFLKIKDWGSSDTRYGFVSNSSNFYNDHSEAFQGYFYVNYGIEKIFELSRVKDILFANAKESVLAIIFTDAYAENEIEYYPVDMGLFSEKPFELLIIQEEKLINIEQKSLIDRQSKLRDFLVGNSFDRAFITKVGSNPLLEDYTKSVNRGFEIWGEDARKKEFSLSDGYWKQLDPKKKDEFLKEFIGKYFSKGHSAKYDKPYITPANLKPFVKKVPTQFISSIDNFHRPRTDRDIYMGKKLMFTRIGSKLNCVYSEVDDYFNFSVYTFKLRDENLYYLFQAVLNSHLIQFYLDFYLRKRVFDSFSRIGNEDIMNIPVPSEIDSDLANRISDVSRKLSEAQYVYSGDIKDLLNELIYDLYELSYWEKQRVRDYFLEKSRMGRKKEQLEVYKNTIAKVIGFYLENGITIEDTPTDFNLIVVKVSLNGRSAAPRAKTVKIYILDEIFGQNTNGNFLASREKIYGDDCVYIIKENINKNWTETKAFEDGRDIIGHIIYNGNGERVH
ncbi:TaqI-like C-terminal specificity domain-containing protein [Pedobacter psychrotolerans]|uniref:TaqI-like C-terminal specificity domain-containing protein n=1 Tax=Pedobacter psychrotolerans TaxID=1843235 RepID=UPI003F97B37D